MHESGFNARSGRHPPPKWKKVVLDRLQKGKNTIFVYDCLVAVEATLAATLITNLIKA